MSGTTRVSVKLKLFLFLFNTTRTHPYTQKNKILRTWAAIFQNSVNHLLACACFFCFPFYVSLPAPFFIFCNFSSNRVEAWTRDVPFLLRQEGRPVAQLVGNTSTVRVMGLDWKNADQATQWIRQRAASSHQPFALYLGLNLPHTYKTKSLGPTAGGSTFLTSPYWLEKACFISPSFLNVLSSLLQNYIACFYINHLFYTHTGVSRAHHCS